MMKFTAKPYKVQITTDDGKVVDIPTFNAEGIFKSLKLDEAKEKINSNLAEYNKFSAKFESLPEEEKSTKETYEKISLINKKLRLATIEYLRECLKDLDNYVDLIDEIKSIEMSIFMSAVERAMFGHTDGEEKKKIPSSTTLKNSKDTAIKKKRLRNGPRSKSTTN